MTLKYDVLVIGGGMTGVETADYLAEHGRAVTIIEMRPDIALDEASGKFVAESTCFERFGPVLVTKQEISGVNAYSGSKVVLGKGTSVQVVGFDFEAKEVYLKSLYEDENLDEKIVVSLTQKGEYSYLIDGKDEQDLFIGLMYAG